MLVGVRYGSPCTALPCCCSASPLGCVDAFVVWLPFLRLKPLFFLVICDASASVRAVKIRGAWAHAEWQRRGILSQQGSSTFAAECLRLLAMRIV